MTNLIEDGMNAIRDTGNKLNQPAGRAPIVRLGERKLAAFCCRRRQQSYSLAKVLETIASRGNTLKDVKSDSAVSASTSLMPVHQRRDRDTMDDNGDGNGSQRNRDQTGF
jgi:hypothetical protein